MYACKKKSYCRRQKLPQMQIVFVFEKVKSRNDNYTVLLIIQNLEHLVRFNDTNGKTGDMLSACTGSSGCSTVSSHLSELFYISRTLHKPFPRGFHIIWQLRMLEWHFPFTTRDYLIHAKIKKKHVPSSISFRIALLLLFQLAVAIA